MRPYQRDPRAPLVRPLRIYTLDPSVSDRMGGVATVHVPYEKLEPGPIGSLFAVNSTARPRSSTAEALDLDDPHLLLSGGLSPTPTNGRFHMQMVYAVCSLTYAAFRRALGRDIAWASTAPADGPLRLVVRPFGFERRQRRLQPRSRRPVVRLLPRRRARRRASRSRAGSISTALSHDIIAHETTHALLDGLRSSFLDPTNVDVPAFHEGFSDLVALFLHFTYADVVEQAIRDSGGTHHARVAADRHRARVRLRAIADRPRRRAAIGRRRRRAWRRSIPTSLPRQGGRPARLRSEARVARARIGARVGGVRGVHDHRPAQDGALLSASPASIARRSAGVPLSEALVKAIAQEACDVAGQFLNICIRAIDYCPPADMELGEYLRAIITADGDIERTDKWGFREALMRSFRRRQIFPDHVLFMTEDAVRWQPPGDSLHIKGLAFRDLRVRGRSRASRRAPRSWCARRTRSASSSPTRSTRSASASSRRPSGCPRASSRRRRRSCSRSASPAAPRPTAASSSIWSAKSPSRAPSTARAMLFDVNGGCTVVIDPEGKVRYSIFKKFDSEDRQARQLAAMRGPLKRFWKKSGRRFELQPHVLRRLHGG